MGQAAESDSKWTRRGNGSQRRQARNGWKILRIQIPKEKEEEEWVMCEGVGGRQQLDKGAEGEGVAGNKQSPWQGNSLENVQQMEELKNKRGTIKDNHHRGGNYHLLSTCYSPNGGLHMYSSTFKPHINSTRHIFLCPLHIRKKVRVRS